ncbi:MAG: glycosyltransferase, partial [Butyricimonas virosa]|uniref:glycosyltransferase n=1 Tax=Butyricimonas virosa TaxID=544645 RepID=UPI00242D4292
FVSTIDRSASSMLSECSDVLFLGKVNVNQCPFLYEQSDIMFLPTLLECFSASYPEAMKMKKPIMTSALGFAKGLCGEAAIYFNPLDARDIADKIYKLNEDEILKRNLITAGIKQLTKFHHNEQRVEMYIKTIISV